MNGRCPACKRLISVPVRRGQKLSEYSCRRCRVALQGVTAGRASGIYLDPITGGVTTAGLTGVGLEQPMRLAFFPGTDGPGRRDQPTADERGQLARVAGRVLGVGCIVSNSFDPHRFDDADEGFRAGQLARAGLRLVPVDDPGDPAGWLVNDKIVHRSCAACGARILDLPENRVAAPWRPARDHKWVGHRHLRRQQPVRQGPHPAGSLACSDCDPGHPAHL